MDMKLMYWILMLLALVFGLWGGWPKEGNYRPLGGSLLLFLLLLLLGWEVFKAPLHH